MPINAPTDILTLAEARERLAVIRPKVEALMALTARIQILSSNTSSTQLDGEQTNEEALDECRVQFLSLLQEINDAGATIKDPSTGLLDFYCWHHDDLIFLCWHSGEQTIEFWHDIKAGYSGRRPVSELSP
ncbi:MAG TPA: DUF2203 domain-containing protein [Planctomycetota bacterium]|nr:DUF2203 domain-containing protein [Planctomycetota bacterium]